MEQVYRGPLQVTGCHESSEQGLGRQEVQARVTLTQSGVGPPGPWGGSDGARAWVQDVHALVFQCIRTKPSQRGHGCLSVPGQGRSLWPHPTTCPTWNDCRKELK